MLNLGHLKCEIPWEKKIHSVDVAVIESEKDFGLIGRDVTRVDHIHNASLSDVKVLPAISGNKATIKLKPDTKPDFLRARKVPLAMEDQVKIELAKLQAQGIIAPVDPGGVMNASPVVWQRKKNGSFRLRADFKVHVNDKIMTKEYPLPDMETIFHELEGSKFYVKIDLSSAYYQIMLDDAAQEICVINTTQQAGSLQVTQTTSRNEKCIRNVPANNREHSQRIGWNYLFPGRRTGTRKNKKLM